MVVRISDKTQNYSKVTKLLVKPNKNYPIEKRKNLFFNPIYLRNLNLIFDDIISKNFDFRLMLDLLKK